MDRVRIRETGIVQFKSEFENELRLNGVGMGADGLNLEALDHFGADPVMPGAQPTGEPWQTAVQDGVVQSGDHWVENWVLTPTFESQEDEDAYVAAWTAAQLKAQTPREISHRQFYQALWETDRITFEEADAAINLGVLPAAIDAFVTMLLSDPMTEKEGQRAKLALTGAKTFERDHYFVMVFSAMFGMTDLEIDTLWRTAGAIE